MKSIFEWNWEVGKWRNGSGMAYSSILYELTGQSASKRTKTSRINDMYAINNDLTVEQCHTELQSIATSKLCLPTINDTMFGLRLPKYRYPKFGLNIDYEKQQLHIETVVKNRYRLWVSTFISHSEFSSKWGYAERKCPKKGFIDVSIKCLLLNKNESIPLGQVLKGSNTIGICINYVSAGPKVFWPLHCISFSISKYDRVSGISFYAMVILITWSSIVGAFTGLAFSTVIYRKFIYYHPENLELPEVPVHLVIDDYESVYEYINIDGSLSGSYYEVNNGNLEGNTYI